MEENENNNDSLFMAGLVFWIVVIIIMWGAYEFLLTQLR